MNVLVTGAAGGVGQHVIRELAASGMQVTGYDARADLGENQIPWVVGDVLDFERVLRALQGQDAVVHLAAVPLYKPEANLDIMRVNVLGAQTVLEACTRVGVTRYVQASSLCATAFMFWSTRRTPRYFPVDEDYADVPDDAYGLSKLVGEQLAHAYSERYGLEVTSLRIATVWVPGNEITEQELGCMLRLESDGDPQLVDLRWQYVDVRDVAQAVRLAVEAAHGLGVCNVGAADTPGGDWRIWLRDLYPDVPILKRPGRMLGDLSQPLWAIDRLVDRVGYRPQHSWREYPRFLAEWTAYKERLDHAA